MYNLTRIIFDDPMQLGYIPEVEWVRMLAGEPEGHWRAFREEFDDIIRNAEFLFA